MEDFLNITRDALGNPPTGLLGDNAPHGQYNRPTLVGDRVRQRFVQWIISLLRLSVNVVAQPYSSGSLS
jgi:hypothetical protein